MSKVELDTQPLFNFYQAFWSDTVDNISAFLEGSPKRVIN